MPKHRPVPRLLPPRGAALDFDGVLRGLIAARHHGHDRQCLTQQQVAAALSGCVEALLYLHRRHKVHRDVKAGNLLLSSDGIVKLADFGVAASINNTSRRRTVIGTPFWMAPEVITCRRGPSGGGSAGYDQLADIWSLGITAIEIAEGQPPHATVSPLTAIFLIPTLPAPRLSDNSRWSSEFVRFIQLCLNKDPSARARRRPPVKPFYF